MSRRHLQTWWSRNENSASPAGGSQEQNSPIRKDSELDGQSGATDGSLTAFDRHYAKQDNIPKRIHLVGVGSIGKLVAHALRGLPNPPPVTLILHRPESLRKWKQSKSRITVNSGSSEISHDGFEVEIMSQGLRQHKVRVQPGSTDVYTLAEELHIRPHEAAKIMSNDNEVDPQQLRDDSTEGAVQRGHGTQPEYESDENVGTSPIHTLIVATKTIHVREVLRRLRPRLSSASTICFLQNGMGVVDEVNRYIFPSEEDRPVYVQGVITHGANSPPELAERDPFYVVHAGQGTIALGTHVGQHTSQSTTSSAALNPNSPQKFARRDRKFQGTTRYLIRTLTRSPILAAVGFTPVELLQQQLEKLAINSVINPLTVLLDNRNGSLLYNFPLTRTMRLMLAETSLVLRSLPELQGIPNIAERFGASRLETLVVSIADKTRNNISSMLADMRMGKRTEVEYINGYIVRRGEELGIKCVVNYAVTQLILAKSNMVRREQADSVPTPISKLSKL